MNVGDANAEIRVLIEALREHRLALAARPLWRKLLDLRPKSEGADTMRPLEDRLALLAELESGWLDGELGDPVTPETIEVARWLVPHLESLHKTSIHVYPTPDGGLSLEWGAGDGEAHTLDILAT